MRERIQIFLVLSHRSPWAAGDGENTKSISSVKNVLLKQPVKSANKDKYAFCVVSIKLRYISAPIKSLLSVLEIHTSCDMFFFMSLKTNIINHLSFTFDLGLVLLPAVELLFVAFSFLSAQFLECIKIIIITVSGTIRSILLCNCYMSG